MHSFVCKSKSNICVEIDSVCAPADEFHCFIVILAHRKVAVAAINTITVGTKISISTVVVTVAAVTRNAPEMTVVMVTAVRKKRGNIS